MTRQPAHENLAIGSMCVIRKHEGLERHVAVAAGVRGGRAPGALRLLGDERLARPAENGYERAFAVVYARHHQALYRYWSAHRGAVRGL